VTSFAQLASCGPEQVVELARALGIPERRIESGGWVAKAAELAAEKSPAIDAS
jgi:predicted flap endonuclease-1-like 5' DNA nuclease